MKKILKICLMINVFVLITVLSFKYVENIKADSGWDSSYGSSSGGSWSSGGSSWSSSSGSSWGSSSSSSNRGSGSANSCTTKECKIENFIFLLIIFTPFISIILISIIESKKKRKQLQLLTDEITRIFSEITQEQANSIIPNFNIEEFKVKAYQIFYDVQMAWMEFEYDKLKELLTDELYNNYIMQLDALKIKNHKNIMKDFNLIKSCIYDLKEENGKYIAEVGLYVEFIDYVESVKSGIILRGGATRKLNNIYKLTFIRTKEESINLNECPSCGASVEGNATGVCEYCKSKLVNENYNWVMSKKEIISQK